VNSQLINILGLLYGSMILLNTFNWTHGFKQWNKLRVALLVLGLAVIINELTGLVEGFASGILYLSISFGTALFYNRRKESFKFYLERSEEP